jgi:hypothetical protein
MLIHDVTARRKILWFGGGVLGLAMGLTGWATTPTPIAPPSVVALASDVAPKCHGTEVARNSLIIPRLDTDIACGTAITGTLARLGFSDDDHRVALDGRAVERGGFTLSIHQMSGGQIVGIDYRP